MENKINKTIMSIFMIVGLLIASVSAVTYTQEEIEVAVLGYAKMRADSAPITWMSQEDVRIYSYSENPFINGKFFNKN